MIVTRRSTRWRFGTYVTLLVLVSGCVSDAPPRRRTGALPFPGFATLFKLADPSALGTSRYGTIGCCFRPGEVSRGILYTRHAGFLDLAHLRDTMDVARFIHTRTSAAISEGRSLVPLGCHDRSGVELRLNLPTEEWLELQNNPALAAEFAVQVSVRAAVDMMTWHEILTWFGYGRLHGLSEWSSAFTYDDPTSHIIGAAAAATALRNRWESWAVAATDALANELSRLEVTSRAEAKEAVLQVQGTWWMRGVAMRRMFDVGNDGSRIKPWLVDAAHTSPFTFERPSLSVGGRDFAPFYSLEITPRQSTRRLLEARLPGLPNIVIADRDFSNLIFLIRQEAFAKLGIRADVP